MAIQIIEFFGLPASGKSTLLTSIMETNITNRLSLVNIQDFKIKPKIRYLKLIFNKSFIAFFLLTVPYIFSGSEKFIYQFKRFKFLLKCYLKYLLIVKLKKEAIYISDNGIFQLLISLIWDKPNEDLRIKKIAANILQTFHVNILFIYTHTEDPKVYQRIHNRTKHIRLLDYNKTSSKKIISLQKMYFNLISITCRSIRVDTEDPCEVCVNRILKILGGL